jgi:uncharacterized protein YkwD
MCAALCASALTSILGCASVENAPAEKSPANPLDSEEGTLVYDLNGYRAQSGLAALKVCASLNVAASAHADDMRDHGYLNDTGNDGSSARSRACASGYMAACDAKTELAELVSSGNELGDQVFPLWTKDATTEPILRNAALVVIGVGRSLGGDVPYWSVDVADHDEASCGK